MWLPHHNTSVTKEARHHGIRYNNPVVFETRREDPLTELLRTGARKLIEMAVQAELVEFLKGFFQLKTLEGKPDVIRNGYHPERKVLTGIGPVSVQISKVGI